MDQRKVTQESGNVDPSANQIRSLWKTDEAAKLQMPAPFAFQRRASPWAGAWSEIRLQIFPLQNNALSRALAEGVGFEPTVRLPARRFSRPVYSTTLAPLRKENARAARGPDRSRLSRLNNKCKGGGQERESRALVWLMSRNRLCELAAKGEGKCETPHEHRGSGICIRLPLIRAPMRSFPATPTDALCLSSRMLFVRHPGRAKPYPGS